ncbi:D-alanyl-D-alanine carboxypeptidase family protein [Desulfovibrio sp. ZJ200]|uniref:D-alanyl-D-alanine carboxypeptidase family protein n=1 Tax=Desulfovibrio sp. ZJ200 TaxID=2709792 RepID=UPI001F154992|nr:D-alanyl-D-alanine carboxypeptidase family protein [Desulfovibrio sp. ZJ200]
MSRLHLALCGPRVARPLRRVLAICLLLCLACAIWLPGSTAAAPAIPAHGLMGVSSAILYDLDNEVILFEQNADERIPPASLTKVLSMFLALDHISAGHANFHSDVPVSRAAARSGGSRMGLRANERVRLEKLLLGMAVSSGNDASMAVAEYVGGSAQAFVNMMNVKARALGMRDSRFLNPHGLPAQGQHTTARDMLTLARAYLRAYPWALKFHNTHVLSHRGRVTRNKNPLLGQYPGADGLKTGWIKASGYNLIFTARQGPKRLLAVILGAPDVRVREAEACRLLDAGFQVCDNQAVSVAAALDRLPVQGYVKKAAHPAGRQYAQSQPASRKHFRQSRASKTAKSKMTRSKPVRSKGVSKTRARTAQQNPKATRHAAQKAQARSS